MKADLPHELDEDEIAKVDEEIEELADDGDAAEAEKKKGKWCALPLVGAEDRLKMVAADRLNILRRVEAMDGDDDCVHEPHICIALYKAIIAIRPDWHSDDDDKGKVKVVSRLCL